MNSNIELSFPRSFGRESSVFNKFWMPAYRRQAQLLTSGMTKIKKALYKHTLFMQVLCVNLIH